MNISFVIPVYNGEKFLSGAVSSIFNGNIAPGDEVIIVDDKSTDNSKSIALKLKKKFGNITILENECNLGEGLTKNIAISLANSGLIFTLDQDNILSKDSIYELRKYLVKNEIDLASFPEVHYFYRFKGMTTHKQFFTKGIFVNDDLPSVNLNIGCNGNFLFKKEAYLKAGKFDNFGLESLGFYSKILNVGLKVGVCDSGLYWHRHGLKTSAFTIAQKSKNLNDLLSESLKKDKYFQKRFNAIIEKDEIVSTSLKGKILKLLVKS